MDNKPNILLIEPFIPYPLTNGGAQAIFHGIQAIREEYHVYVLFTSRMGEKYFHEFEQEIGPDVTLLPYLPVKSARLPLKNRIALSLYYRTGSDRLRVQDPFEEKTVEPVFSEDFLRYVHEIISKHSISIVQVEMPWVMSIVLGLPQSVKKVFVHHELRFVRNELELKTYGENLYRRAAVELNKIQEIGLLNRYDAIVTLSETDKEKLLREGVNVPVHSSFAIVNTAPKAEEITKMEKTVSFVGPEFHLPNQKGIQWFLSACWPRLLQKDPAYQFQIIGNWDETTKTSLASRYKNIKFLGFVDHLQEALTNTVMIVPIRIGSGIRMKILEAAANGVPFVSTQVGAEGLPFVSGKECFIADDPDTFVDGILRLQDSDLANAFVQAARCRVQTQFSLAALKQNRCEILKSIIR